MHVRSAYGRIVHVLRSFAPHANEVLFYGVIAVSFALHWVLLANYFERAYEPDTSFGLIDQYLKAAEGLNFSALSAPNGRFPYFDAGSILYAGFAGVLRITGFWSKFSTSESIYTFSVYAVNIGLYSISVGVFYRICYRLSASLLLSAVLAVMFAVSPQILGINPLRIDYLLYSLIVVVCWLCIRVIQGSGTRFVAYSLGFTSALLAGTKVTSLSFLGLPLLAFWVSWRKQYSPVLWRRFLLSFIAIFALVMVRYIYHGSVWSSFVGGIIEAKKWSGFLSVRPYLFYNIDNFSEYGVLFLSTVFASVCVLAICAVSRKDGVSIFVVVPLLCFSFLLVWSPKLARWGIVVSFYYFLAIAVAFSYAHRFCQSLRFARLPLRQGIPVLLACLLAPPAYAFMGKYRAVYVASTHKPAAIAATKTVPMRWFEKNADQNAVVCIIVHSDWVMPPLSRVKVKVGPFDFPYLDPVLMGVFPPPEVKDVSRECEYILIDRFHRDLIVGAFKTYGQNEMKDSWQNFWDAGLSSRYDHLSFTTTYPEWSWWNLDLYVRRSI